MLVGGKWQHPMVGIHGLCGVAGNTYVCCFFCTVQLNLWKGGSHDNQVLEALVLRYAVFGESRVY